MACGACGKQRREVVRNIRAGNVRGTLKSLSLGARMIAEKLAGVDINEKYLGSGDGVDSGNNDG